MTSTEEIIGVGGGFGEQQLAGRLADVGR